MNDTTQHSLATWVPADVLVAAVVLLLGVIWWTWKREQSRQLAALDKLALSFAELNIRLTGLVTVADYSRSISAVHEKINNQGERLAIIEDRMKRS